MTTLYAPPLETDDFIRAMSSPPITAPLSPSILIADDDDDVRDVIEFRLQVAGYRTLTADNGRSALNLAIERRPRVIILDVRMPQIDGLTVCNRLHASPSTAEIPVLMISGNCEEYDRELGLAAGADDYLPKPFTSHEMMRRVNWLLLSAGN
ncbi:response regulator [Paractinoplanes maris]|uniref:response regulator n=1 Tax=Paractinoplanes maris TaxID=1734446 RepID=UPI002021503E|nr:response regulator [Actinoplanes maris]